MANRASTVYMDDALKSCPFVLRKHGDQLDVLAFQHPTAGKQFVKGTIESGETALVAAHRELFEESGILVPGSMRHLGCFKLATIGQRWEMFAYVSSGLPDHWGYDTIDDFGHRFEFFWHPLVQSLTDEWHPMFHEARKILAQCLCDIDLDTSECV